MNNPTHFLPIHYYSLLLLSFGGQKGNDRVMKSHFWRFLFIFFFEIEQNQMTTQRQHQAGLDEERLIY